MPISVNCECGKSLRAPDSLAGKKAKCPQCGAVVSLPAAVVNAELDDAPPLPPKKKSAAVKPRDEEFDDSAESDAESSADERKPCPLCGEMIVASAAKCRFCGEVFDSSLDRPRKSKSGKTGSWSKGELRNIAGFQKALLLCILGQILTFVLQTALPPQIRPLGAVAYLIVCVVAVVFVFRLAMRLYSTATGVICGILTLIPCIGLLVLLVVNGKATRVLQDHGIKVGFLGAKSSDI